MLPSATGAMKLPARSSAARRTAGATEVCCRLVTTPASATASSPKASARCATGPCAETSARMLRDVLAALVVERLHRIARRGDLVAEAFQVVRHLGEELHHRAGAGRAGQRAGRAARRRRAARSARRRAGCRAAATARRARWRAPCRACRRSPRRRATDAARSPRSRRAPPRSATPTSRRSSTEPSRMAHEERDAAARAWRTCGISRIRNVQKA